MADPIIQKLYDLNSEDLSYRLCEYIFGKSDIGEVKVQYKTEISIDAKMIVNTYDNKHQENGRALIIRNHSKNTDDFYEGDVNFIVQHDHLFIIADYDCFIDVKQFNLGEVFPSNRYMTGLYADILKPIYFFSQGYKDIGLEKQEITLGIAYTVQYRSDSSLNSKIKLAYTPTIESMNLVYEPEEVKEMLPLRLGYIKASSTPALRFNNESFKRFDNKTNFSFAEFYSRTKPGAELAGEGKLQVTFIPLKEMKAFLGE